MFEVIYQKQKNVFDHISNHRKEGSKYDIQRSMFDENTQKYIEDITRWRTDMNFMFSWQEQYLTSERSSLVRYCSCHENIKFISFRHRVISSIYFCVFSSNILRCMSYFQPSFRWLEMWSNTFFCF